MRSAPAAAARDLQPHPSEHREGYRHFPTMPPIEALRARMLLFVDYIATKQLIAPALNTLVGGASKVFESSSLQVHETIRALVKRAIKSGDIRKDLEATRSAPGFGPRLQRGVQS